MRSPQNGSNWTYMYCAIAKNIMRVCMRGRAMNIEVEVQGNIPDSCFVILMANFLSQIDDTVLCHQYPIFGIWCVDYGLLLKCSQSCFRRVHFKKLDLASNDIVSCRDKFQDIWSTFQVALMYKSSVCNCKWIIFVFMCTLFLFNEFLSTLCVSWHKKMYIWFTYMYLHNSPFYMLDAYGAEGAAAPLKIFK